MLNKVRNFIRAVKENNEEKIRETLKKTLEEKVRNRLKDVLGD